MRVYLDGGAVPFAEGLTTDLAGGRTLCGWPLSAGLAPESPVVKQGSNLYLPIPYANGCKVTVEIPAKGNFYYNIETRAYAGGTVVRTLTREALLAASNLVARTCADLKDCYSRPEPAADRWHWVLAAIRLLRDSGLRLNPGSPELCRELAWMFELKSGTDLDAAAGHYRVEWKRIVEDVRARGAWEELGMDPKVMLRIEQATGFDDWTDPQLSAIYWAALGGCRDIVAQASAI